MTKIDIFSGFLGAGKTTLIRKMISEVYQGEKVVLIENEFGNIGIDGTFLKETGVSISEVNSGCICCSMSGDFEGQLQSIIGWQAPDRILIEPSGVAKLSELLLSIENVRKVFAGDGTDDVKVNACTAVVDAKRYNSCLRNFGEFYIDQITYAGCIILSRTDEITEEALISCVKVLREYNPDAAIISTSWDLLSGEQILEAAQRQNHLAREMEDLADEEKQHSCPVCGGHFHEQMDLEERKVCTCGHDHAHHFCGCGHEPTPHHTHDAEEVFVSWGVETPKGYTRDELLRILAEFTDEYRFGMILRAKGTVAGPDGWHCFDYVPEEYRVWKSQPETMGRICVIGAHLYEEQLEKAFQID